jgi:phosphopantothenoylcysteine synthetase/decarboxylase
LGESNRQLIRGVVLTAGVVTVGIINDEAASAVAAAVAAAAAAAACGFDGSEQGFVGEEGSRGDEDDIDIDDDDDDDDDDEEEDDDEDEDTVTDLPSSKLQFDSDDDSYDEDQKFSQQVNFYG